MPIAIPRTIKLSPRQVALGAVTVSLALAATVSIGAGVAFAFCSYVVLTA